MAINLVDGRSVLYRDSGGVPFASRLSSRARRAIYKRFVETLSPSAAETTLDIGVTSDSQFLESNFFERFYPYKNRITCVGTEDGSHLEEQYPGVCFVPLVSGQPLPFAAQHFDIVFSNAVIEHVGDRQRQQFFLAEALRVSRRFFIATPNRWFPIEVHTGLPFLHYLPPAVFRAILSRSRLRSWAEEENLNLLTKPEFASLFPPEACVTLEFQGIGLGHFKSNLVAYGYAAGREG